MNKQSPEQRIDVLAVLQARFAKHPERHGGLEWADVAVHLLDQPDKLAALQAMEASGGEPDVVGVDEKSGAYIFMDCAPESPAGRRSLCYDPQALASRKANKPAHSALGLAADMGIEVLTEAEYRALQELGEFDRKTSSWILTPPGIRDLGGALFCDRRYDQVFVYHNGAESYCGGRGFRGKVLA